MPALLLIRAGIIVLQTLISVISIGVEGAQQAFPWYVRGRVEEQLGRVSLTYEVRWPDVG